MGPSAVRAVVPHRRVTAALLVVVSVAALVALARTGRASGAALRGRPRRVLLVGVPKLEWSALRSPALPHLSHLARTGAVAAMTVRTGSLDPNDAEAWASIGAGTRLWSKAGVGHVEKATTATRVPATDLGSLKDSNRGHHVSAPPGSLGSALHRAGRRTAVVAESAGGAVRAPAALAVMDRQGRLGVELESGDVASAVDAALAATDVVAVQLPRSLPALDVLVGQLTARLAPDTLLVLAGITPPGATWRLEPVIVSGPGVPRGHVTSFSTRRRGLVTLTDLAPTVLGALQVHAPAGMIGHPFRYEAGTPALAPLRELDRTATYRERIYFPLLVAFVIFQALIYILAIAVLSGRDAPPDGAPNRFARLLRVPVLAIGAWPLSTFLFRAVPRMGATGWWGVVLLVAIDLAITAWALRARTAFRGLAWTMGATTALLMVDVATGARLQMASLLGYSPHTAARFYGIGNEAFAILGATSILAAVTVLEGGRDPRRLRWLAWFFAAVVVVDGAPFFGADGGGTLTLVPVLGLLWLVLAGYRLTWRRVLVAAVVALGVALLAVGIDALRAPEARTHLSRFVGDAFGGNSAQSSDTLGRKIATNLRLLRTSVWTWMVPITAILMLFVFVGQRRLAELLPPRSPRRAAFVAAAAVGLVGLVLNDSGVVITAVVSVYLSAYLTLLALS